MNWMVSRRGAFAMSALLVAATAGPVLAGPREDAQAGIARCAVSRDDHTYLDCVYGAVQPLRASLGLTPAPAAQLRLVPPAMAGAAVVVAAPKPMARQGGGLLGKGIVRQPISAYNFDKSGMITVTLTDGEIWRQTADDTNYAHLKGPASNYTVSIADGLDVSEMTVNDEATIFLVRRVR